MSSTTLAPGLLELVRGYRTCELATIGRDGTPVAWPVIPWFDEERGVFEISTSVGFPAKAFNVRRDPAVSLLFSDPTGSGLSHPPALLVQGSAECPDEVWVDPTPHADYWRHLYRRQPAGRAYGANPLTRYAFDWYFFRLHLTVTPGTVTLLEPLGQSQPGEGADLRPPRTADAATTRLVSELRHHTSAVLSWRDPDGRPTSRRVSVRTEGAALLLPSLTEPVTGPASLLAHRHDEQTWNLRSVVALGRVADRGRGPELAVRRVVPGASPDPRALLRTLVRARRSTRLYLARRQLDRPAVPWEAYRALYP